MSSSEDLPEVHPLDGRLFGPGQPCFGCAPDHPIGFHLAFERDGVDLVTRFVADERYQGPPGVMHGGLVTTLADEIAAWTIVAGCGRFGFTATMEARFAGPVRIGVAIEGRGRLTSRPARLTKVEVTLRQEGAEKMRAGFTFALPDEKGAEKILGGPLPVAWRRFTRS